MIFTSALTNFAVGQSCLQKRRILQELDFRRVFSQPHGWRGNLRLGCGAEAPPWKTQSGASLYSCLHCRANMVVCEHWALLLRKMGSDSFLQAQQGFYREKGESHPWGWWGARQGLWQPGCI